MVAYVLIAIITFLVSFVDLVKVQAINRTGILIGIFMLMLLFLGTRTVGPDLDTYEIFYNTTPSSSALLASFAKYSAETLFEPGFLILIGICKSLHFSFNGFNLVCSFIILYIFFKGTVRLSSAVFVSILVYLAYGYIYAFSVIRQVMAASIFFYGLQYLLIDKKWTYACYVLIACMFHYSAVILFIFCVINKNRVSSKMILLVVGSSIAAVYSGILSMIAQRILFLIPFFSEKKINQYLEVDDSFIGSVSLVWMLILIICLSYRRKFERIDGRFNLYLNVLWIGLTVYAFSVGFGGFGRVLLYFKLIYVLVLPLFVIVIKERIGKALCIVLIGIMCFTFFFASIIGDTRYSDVNRYLPYNSWLTGKGQIRH